MKNLTERLDKHLENIKEDNNIKLELNKILTYAKNLFKNNDSSGWGDQIPKSLKLLELVAKEDLEAKAEGRKFNPKNIKIDVKSIVPDPVTYAKDRGFWDGGDDEDYAHCCLYFEGDGDTVEVSKKFLSREAKHFIEDIAEDALKIYFDKVDKAYDKGVFKEINSHSKETQDARFKRAQDEYFKYLKKNNEDYFSATGKLFPKTPGAALGYLAGGALAASAIKKAKDSTKKSIISNKKKIFN